MRILLVEDDAVAARLTAKGLRERGYAVDTAHDGAEALKAASAVPYDVIVLDLNLPEVDGLAVCRRIRAAGDDASILMLTARDALADRVAGLDAGADDYLTKPFHFSELLARVRALSRRRAVPLLPAQLSVGPLVLDTRSRRAAVDGRRVELTAREYALLEFLARRPGTVLSRSEIADHVWDDRYDPASNVIDVFIQRLRRKLGGEAAALIRTRRGAGYQLGDAGPR